MQIFSRWFSASDWDTELKCDGNQVAVGACAGGGGFGHMDCPGSGGGICLIRILCSIKTYSSREHDPPAEVLRDGGVLLQRLQHLQLGVGGSLESRVL